MFSINPIKELVIKLESPLPNLKADSPKPEIKKAYDQVRQVEKEAKSLASALYKQYRAKTPTYPQPAPIPSPVPTAPPAQNPPKTEPNPGGGQGISLYNDTQSQLHNWLKSNPNHPQAQALKTQIANVPKAIWLGEWHTDLDRIVREAMERKQTPVFILYNAIKRDLGSYSAGGAGSLEKYFAWIEDFSRKLGNGSAIIVLEPDALPHMPSMSQADRGVRVAMLQGALRRLENNVNAKVYVDAGHSNWLAADQTAELLRSIGTHLFDGFALNVSNRRPNDELIRFGKEIASRIGNKHFIIDTSRNGIAHSEWCNPSPEKIGQAPTFNTGEPLCDAFLWLKSPGESDGTCNGGLPAGQLWIERAIQLAS